MKFEENLNMIWGFSSLPKFTYSILYVAINYVHNNIWKTMKCTVKSSQIT